MADNRPSLTVNPLLPNDLDGIKAILDATELFPSEMLDDMYGQAIAEGSEPSVWLSVQSEGAVIGFAYAQQETFTDGTWNLRAIAVHPEHHRVGAASALLRHLEQELKSDQARLVLIDTASSADYAGAQAFYAKQGYELEARIRDYWANGDDKITYAKSLVG